MTTKQPGLPYYWLRDGCSQAAFDLLFVSAFVLGVIRQSKLTHATLGESERAHYFERKLKRIIFSFLASRGWNKRLESRLIDRVPIKNFVKQSS